jgi:hypothetical protein
VSLLISSGQGYQALAPKFRNLHLSYSSSGSLPMTVPIRLWVLA